MSCEDIEWQASGERRAAAGEEAEVWLALTARTRVWQVCQRCLQPFNQPLAVATRLRFVRGEAQAEALDAQVDEDVLALTRALDLRVLVEDELLLALPLVPRHGACDMPITAKTGDAPAPVLAERANPFATLQQLKSGRRKPG